MKILQIPTGGLFYDGIYGCIASYISHMARTDMTMDLLATNDPQDGIVQALGDLDVNVRVIPCRKRHPVRYFLKLTALIRAEGYDIIHVHGSSGLMAIELLAGKLAGCKVRIAHSHNTFCDHGKADKLLRPLFDRLYTHAFACGQDAGRWLFGERPFTVLPNGRDLDQFAFSPDSREQVRSEWGVTPDTLVIGHVGRFNTQKNQGFLLDAFREIRERRPDSKLVLVGTGERIDDVKAQAESNGLGQSVIFTGEVKNVPRLLSAMDIMVLPSLYEGLPLVAIEWQAAGLPCVLSDAVTDECVIEQNVFKLSLSESPEKWAEKILSIPLPDREESADRVKADMRAAGYDIQEDAKKLRSFYCEFVRGGK